MQENHQPPQAQKQEQTQQFPCPSCGADMTYDAGKGCMACAHCGATASIDTSRAKPIQEHFSFDTQEASRRWQGERQISCPSCGSVWVVHASEASATCPYCGIAHVAELDEAMIAPDAVIPFMVDEKAAGNAFKKWVSGRLFSPRALQTEHFSGHWRGMYYPYWTYDAKTESDYSGMAGFYYYVPVQRTRTVNGKQEIYTEQERRTRWEPRSGHLQLDFDDVLVRAIVLVEKAAAPENFDLQQLKPYMPHFLGGFLAMRYDLSVKEGFEYAKQNMESGIHSAIRGEVACDEWNLTSLQTDYREPSYKHILLPLWGNHYTYRGKQYDVWVNGQNGRVSGKAPISAWKVLLCIGGVALLAFLVWFFFFNGEEGVSESYAAVQQLLGFIR